MIKFFCSFCGQKVSTSDNSAGNQAACPTCGKIIAIPISAEHNRSNAIKRGHTSDVKIEYLFTCEFEKKIKNGHSHRRAPMPYDMSPFSGKPFDCGCGKTHEYNHMSTPVFWDLGMHKVCLLVKECKHLNAVKVTGFFNTKKMKTLFTCRFDEERERSGFSLEYPRIDEEITLCINGQAFRNQSFRDRSSLPKSPCCTIMNHSPEVICPSCHRPFAIRPPEAPCAMECIWCKQPFLISASDIEALERNEIITVSPHPDAIVDALTLKGLCCRLTTQIPTSPIEYVDFGVREEPNNPTLNLGKHRVLTTFLRFDYRGKEPHDIELIYLYLFDYYETGETSALFAYKNSSGTQTVIAMTANMHDWREDRKGISSVEIEASIKVARWMVAEGAQLGLPGANAIITRRDTTPNHLAS